MNLLPTPFQGVIGIAGGSLRRIGTGENVAAEATASVTSGAPQAVIFGRVRFVDGRRDRELSIEDELLSRWRERGDAVLDELTGEFLVALSDPGTGRALIAVDRFSTFPLFWAEHGGRLGFSARPDQAATLAGRPYAANWQAIFAYVYFHMIPAPLSIFDGVQRLDLGEALRVDGGRLTVFRYWNPVFDETRPFDFARERASFLAAVHDGVAECTAGFEQDRIGCFLSGGTDSSTIAGMVTRHFGAPARTFSIGFDVGGYDESRYSRLAAEHFGTDHTEYYLKPEDVLSGVDVIASGYEQPFGNSSAVPTYFCAQIARDKGITRMLGGDGGDELYGGNVRYAKQAVFAYYERAPRMLRDSMIEPLLFGAMKNVDAKLIAKARSYIEQAKEPLPDRLQSRYNLLNWLGADDVFTAGFLERVDTGQPLALEREVWSRGRAANGELSQLNHLLAWDFKFTLADSDLPKVTRMCHAAGVEVAFPMLTRALVEHSLQLRPDQKMKGRRLRHLFKESLRGFLPDEIIEKQKQGFGVPFGDWVLSNEGLRARADDALGSLADRGIIRAEFLDRLRGELRSGHAGYFGTMVWILMILELWLRQSPLAGISAK